MKAWRRHHRGEAREELQRLEENATDEYATYRSLYNQNRRAAIAVSSERMRRKRKTPHRFRCGVFVSDLLKIYLVTSIPHLWVR